MKKYKGYYIDHVEFNSEKDIDEFIKDCMIKHIRKLLDNEFHKYPMEAAREITIYEKGLHDEFGLTYDEIEAAIYA